MSRTVVILLVFSLAANVGLLTAGVVHWTEAHRGGEVAASGSYTIPPVVDEASDPEGGTPGLHPSQPRGRGMGRGRGLGLGHGRMAQRAFQRWPEHRVERLHGRLHLTPEQRLHLEGMLSEFRERMAGATRELARVRYETARLMAQDPVNAGAVKAGMRRGTELQAGIDSLVTEAMLREAEVLDPIQRRRYVEVMSGGDR